MSGTHRPHPRFASRAASWSFEPIGIPRIAIYGIYLGLMLLLLTTYLTIRERNDRRNNVNQAICQALGPSQATKKSFNCPAVKPVVPRSSTHNPSTTTRGAPFPQRSAFPTPTASSTSVWNQFPLTSTPIPTVAISFPKSTTTIRSTATARSTVTKSSVATQTTTATATATASPSGLIGGLCNLLPLCLEGK